MTGSLLPCPLGGVRDSGLRRELGQWDLDALHECQLLRVGPASMSRLRAHRRLNPSEMSAGLETGVPLREAEPLLLASIFFTLFAAINEVLF